MNNEETKLLDIQLIAISFYIASLFTSFIITYNDKLRTENKETILSNRTVNVISISNRVLIVILSLVFLYTNYKDRENAKNQNQPLEPFNLQIVASEITVLAALIVLYVVVTSENYSFIIGAQNPNL